MNADEIKVEWNPLGSTGHVRVVLTWAGGSFTDSFNATSFKARRQFLNSLLEKHPGITVDVVDRELEKIAAELAKSNPKSESDDENGESDNELLIGLGSDKKTVELFHSGTPSDGEAFARIACGDFYVTWGIRTRSFGTWMRQQFYRLTRRSPSAQAFADAVNTLDAIARFDGESINVYLRVAPFEGKVVIDLCNDAWSVVVVDAAGWRIVSSEKSPVRFTRKRGMLALPMPVRGGSINELRPFLNFKSDEQWRLYTCSLVTLQLPEGPYPVLGYTGEQGSAKSTMLDKTRALIDPNSSARRQLPRDIRDLMIAAQNAHLLSFDNLSHISPAISDALCTLSTGGGLGTRELYTDTEEVIFNAKRPVLLNGIEDVTTRPDLLDRSVIFDLPAIPEEKRREEADLERGFAEAWPRIFGALLDALSGALRLYPTIQLDRKPRMADFARWGTAAERAFGWPAGSFMDAYTRNRNEAHSIAIESSAVGTPLLTLIRTEVSWKGTATALLARLEAAYADDRRQQRKDWPRTARGMSEALKRISPALRAHGVDVRVGERENDPDRTRMIHLSLPQTPGLSGMAPDGPDGADDVVAAPGVEGERNPPPPDGPDDLDGVVPTQGIEPNGESGGEGHPPEPDAGNSPYGKPGTKPSEQSGPSGFDYDPLDAAADERGAGGWRTDEDEGGLFTADPEDERP